MVIKVNKDKRQRGSLTVEAAIVLPIFICVFVSIIFLIKIVYVHEIIQHGITEAANEIASYSYVYYITEGDEQVTRIIDTIQDSELGSGLSAYLEKYKNMKAFEVLTKTIVLQHIEKHSQKLHIMNGVNGLDFSESTFLLDNKHVDVVVRYKLKLPLPIDILPDIHIVQRVLVRAWLGGEGADLSDEDVGGDIWGLPPMQRGKEIQNIFGREESMPHNFPVIAKFANGKATSIKSINLTDDTYQKSSNVKYKVKGFINDLDQFKGAKVRGFEIKESQIISKELILVVPKDSMNSDIQTTIEWCKRYARSKGIDFVVKEL